MGREGSKVLKIFPIVLVPNRHGKGGLISISDKVRKYELFFLDGFPKFLTHFFVQPYPYKFLIYFFLKTYPYKVIKRNILKTYIHPEGNYMSGRYTSI